MMQPNLSEISHRAISLRECEISHSMDKQKKSELFARFEAVKPASLTWAAWAREGKVSSSFFQDIRKKGTQPSSENMRSVLSVIGLSLDDFNAGQVSPTVASNAQPFKFEGSSLAFPSNDLPIYGTALGSPRQVEGDAIEQTTLNRGETIGYARRPTILNGRADAYGLYVQGHSMVPRFDEGELIAAETKRPARVGDDVVVYLCRQDENLEDDEPRAVLVKRLVRRSASFIELEQFQPPRIFKISMKEVWRIDRILDRADLMG